jgi:hypothetical protein
MLKQPKTTFRTASLALVPILGVGAVALGIASSSNAVPATSTGIPGVSLMADATEATPLAPTADPASTTGGDTLLALSKSRAQLESTTADPGAPALVRLAAQASPAERFKRVAAGAGLELDVASDGAVICWTPRAAGARVGGTGCWLGPIDPKLLPYQVVHVPGDAADHYRVFVLGSDDVRSVQVKAAGSGESSTVPLRQNVAVVEVDGRPDSVSWLTADGTSRTTPVGLGSVPGEDAEAAR